MMPERQCSKCTPSQKKRWGCFAKKYAKADQTTGALLKGKDGKPIYFWTEPAHLPVTIDGEEHYECPRQHIRENPRLWQHFLLYYNLYGKGHLPDDGSVSRQSHFAMSLFTLLDEYNRECDEALDAERRRKENMKAPG